MVVVRLSDLLHVGEATVGFLNTVLIWSVLVFERWSPLRLDVVVS
jgi:hypothetical protein